jgi:hypothetical protein
MFTGILSALSLLGGVAGKAFDYFGKRADVDLGKYKIDGEVDHDLVQADVQLIQAQRDLLLAQNPYKGYRYLHYLFGYPLGIYWASLLFTKVTEKMPGMTQFSWDIPDLSPTQTIWAGSIVAGLTLHSAVSAKWR